MVVDFDTHLLFGNPTTILTTPAQQEFSSKDAGSSRKYIQNKHKYLTQHNFASRLAHLQDAWDPNLAEQLDRDFQSASSSAAKSVRSKTSRSLCYETCKTPQREECHQTGLIPGSHRD